MTMGMFMIMTRARVTISEPLHSMYVLSMLLTLPSILTTMLWEKYYYFYFLY